MGSRVTKGEENKGKTCYDVSVTEMVSQVFNIAGLECRLLPKGLTQIARDLLHFSEGKARADRKVNRTKPIVDASVTVVP